GEPGDAVGGPRSGDGVHGGQGRDRRGRHAGGVRERRGQGLRTAVTGRLQATGREDEIAHSSGAVSRVGVGGVGGDGRYRVDRCGWGEARPHGVPGRELGRRDRAGDQPTQGLVIHGGPAGDARGAGGGAAIDVQPQPYPGGRVGHVLVDERVG